jgi:Fe-S-cluster-containing hydrogenase component 2
MAVCPHAVFDMDGETVHIVDRDACMECGACARNCPVGAVSVEAGVGCAIAVIRGALRGTAPDCGCSGNTPCCGA